MDKLLLLYPERFMSKLRSIIKTMTPEEYMGYMSGLNAQKKSHIRELSEHSRLMSIIVSSPDPCNKKTAMELAKYINSGGKMGKWADPLILSCVKKYPHMPWSFWAISRNSCMNEATLRYMIRIKSADLFNWTWISVHTPLSIEFIREYRDYINWSLITCNPAITMEHINSNGDLPWGLIHVARNVNMDPELLLEKHSHCIYGELNSLSHNKDLTWWMVQKYPELRWCYITLCSTLYFNNEMIPKLMRFYPYSVQLWMFSSNPHLTHEILEMHINEDWDWKQVCSNPSISPDWLLRNVNVSRDIPKYICLNPNITWLFVRLHQNVQWNWSLLWEHMSRRRIEWCPMLHKYFPDSDKRRVVTMLLVFRNELPREVSYQIISQVI